MKVGIFKVQQDDKITSTEGIAYHLKGGHLERLRRNEMVEGVHIKDGSQLAVLFGHQKILSIKAYGGGRTLDDMFVK